VQNYHSSPQYNKTDFQLKTYRMSNEVSVRMAINNNIFEVLKKLQGVVYPEEYFGVHADIDVVGEPDHIFYRYQPNSATLLFAIEVKTERTLSVDDLVAYNDDIVDYTEDLSTENNTVY